MTSSLTRTKKVPFSRVQNNHQRCIPEANHFLKMQTNTKKQKEEHIFKVRSTYSMFGREGKGREGKGREVAFAFGVTPLDGMDYGSYSASPSERVRVGRA